MDSTLADPRTMRNQPGVLQPKNHGIHAILPGKDSIPHESLQKIGSKGFLVVLDRRAGLYPGIEVRFTEQGRLVMVEKSGGEDVFAKWSIRNYPWRSRLKGRREIRQVTVIELSPG